MKEQGRAHRTRPILVIEDDPDIRESLQDALESEGYSVATAMNGKDGLQCLQRLHEMSEEPFIILLDLMMPVMSGDEFLVVLRKNDDVALANIPVVVVSAWPDAAAKVRERAQGYVAKPVALEALLDVVRRFGREDSARRTGGPSH